MKVELEKTRLLRRSPVEVLRSIFMLRKETNPQYSLNAFARDIGLSASLLSRILNGARALTLKQGMQISAMLDFSASETRLFILGIVEHASPSAKISQKVREKIRAEVQEERDLPKQTPGDHFYFNYDAERFRIISQWYHLAILNLTFVEGFDPAPDWIASRLGITMTEAKDAVDRLLELGFLEKNSDGQIRKSQANLYFKTDRSELAIRNHHTQMIEKALQELKNTHEEAFERRLINGITFACSPEHIPILKKKIHQFQDEVLALTKAGPHQEVYQMNCQLFPLNPPPKKSGVSK